MKEVLSIEKREFYQENSYLLVKGFLSSHEAGALRGECRELSQRLSATREADATWGSVRESWCRCATRPIRPATTNTVPAGQGITLRGFDPLLEPQAVH